MALLNFNQSIKTNGLFFILLLFTATASQAQPIKQYSVVIYTPTGKAKGIFYRADSGQLIIDTHDGSKAIKTGNIERIKVRKVKRAYQVKRFVKYADWEVDYSKTNSYGNRVDKNGREAPTLEEEIQTKVGNTFVNAILNMLVAPFHAINPAVNTFEYKSQQEYANQLDDLNYYSIFYQRHPVFIKLQPLNGVD